MNRQPCSPYIKKQQFSDPVAAAQNSHCENKVMRIYLCLERGIPAGQKLPKIKVGLFRDQGCSYAIRVYDTLGSSQFHDEKTFDVATGLIREPERNITILVPFGSYPMFNMK